MSKQDDWGDANYYALHGREILGVCTDSDTAKQRCRDHSAGRNIAPEVYQPGSGGGR